ncbi:MAG: hypothetical protein LBC75_10595 [Fibromonadaceae bacterium]|jgi:hypothetical protein|nr:hypothetical protein [Fibromonadaceae bacterium]
MRICIVLLILFISYANAQDSTGVSIYFHPLSLTVNLFNTEEEDLTVIYSTIENPFNLSRSLIVKPSLLMERNIDITLFRLGSDIGIRHYVRGKGKGFYLQEQIGIFYYKNKNVRSDDDVYSPILVFYPANTESFLLDVAGYLGHSWKYAKLSVFADIGFGAAIADNNIIDPKRFRFYPFIDINLGIGISI